MTPMAALAAPPRVAEAFERTRRLTILERLALAKLLLDSVLSDESADKLDWFALSLDIFQRDWDNVEDAVYDDWREHYGVPAR